MEIYREEACQTAEALIEALVKASEGGAALFRGVSDANYTLTPSMYRKEGMARLNELARYEPLLGEPVIPRTPLSAQAWDRLTLQHNVMMSHFFAIANRRNLIDLGLDRATFEALDRRSTAPQRSPGEHQFKDIDRPSFPETATLPLLALMQHQGLPTPLLDWSEDLLTACFFASDRKTDALGENIAVYALRTSFFNGASRMALTKEQILMSIPRLYYPSYRGNVNLFAQAGAMSYVAAPHLSVVDDSVEVAFDLKIALERFSAGLDTDQTKLLRRYVSEEYAVLQKFTLPREQVGALRARLRAFGVTASAIYPGFDGVRREIEGPG